MSDRTVVHASFTIERHYPVPPQRVYRAFADEATKRRWFAEGEGWEVERFELAPDTDGTLLRLTEQGAYLDREDAPQDRERGTRELLEALAHELEVGGAHPAPHQAGSPATS
jgi:uncharacterized protein YndB with AHSA1/START domain